MNDLWNQIIIMCIIFFSGWLFIWIIWTHASLWIRGFCWFANLYEKCHVFSSPKSGKIFYEIKYLFFSDFTCFSRQCEQAIIWRYDICWEYYDEWGCFNEPVQFFILQLFKYIIQCSVKIFHFIMVERRMKWNY